MKLKISNSQFFRFVIVGSISTIINYSSFYLFYTFLTINYVVSSATGYVAGLLVGFVINKSWTFGAEGQYRKFIFTYLIIYILSLLIGVMFIRFLVEELKIMPEIANIMVIGVTTLTNFIGVKFLVFKKWIF